MKWFKHDSNANMDDKLQDVLLDYGLEGYGLYWYCVELISSRVENGNLTFELKHDARVIARNTCSTPQKVEQMMKEFIDVGLFESSDGVITCLKLAKRLDQSMTSNPEMRDIIKTLKNHDSLRNSHDSLCNSHDPIMMKPDPVMTNSAIVMQDKNRLDKNRLDKNKKGSSAKHDDVNYSVFNLSDDHINEIKRIRKKNNKGATITQRVANTLAKQFKMGLDAGFNIDDMLDEWELRGWAGFKADWMKSDNQQLGKPSATVRRLPTAAEAMAAKPHNGIIVHG